VPGAEQACACVGGPSGAQRCLADGTWDVCVCLEAGAPWDDFSTSDDGGNGSDAGSGDDGGDAGVADDLGVDGFAADDAASGDLAGADLAASPSPDLAGVDLAPLHDFGGITCADAVCSGGAQLCCLSGSGANGSCAPSSDCDGGSPFSCDGPEDCGGGQCCVAVDTQGTYEVGRSYCAATCPNGSFTLIGLGRYHEISILCHSDAECVGYSGQLLGAPTTFTACCHSTATAPYRVCIPASFAPFGGYSCP
jgi:hypothetical protein